MRNIYHALSLSAARVCQRQRRLLLGYSETLVENRRFERTTSLVGAPVVGAGLEFSQHLWNQQTRVHELSLALFA